MTDGASYYVDTRYNDYSFTAVALPVGENWKFVVEIRDPSGRVVKAMKAPRDARFPTPRIAADVGTVMARLWVDRSLLE